MSGLFNATVCVCGRRSAGCIEVYLFTILKASNSTGRRAVQTETSKCMRGLAKSCVIAQTHKRKYEHENEARYGSP